MDEFLCLLIKNGYGSYNEVLSMPIHSIIRHSNMISEQRKKELKHEQEYDIALAKFNRCPLTSSRRK